MCERIEVASYLPAVMGRVCSSLDRFLVCTNDDMHPYMLHTPLSSEPIMVFGPEEEDNANMSTDVNNIMTSPSHLLLWASSLFHRRPRRRGNVDENRVINFE